VLALSVSVAVVVLVAWVLPHGGAQIAKADLAQSATAGHGSLRTETPGSARPSGSPTPTSTSVPTTTSTPASATATPLASAASRQPASTPGAISTQGTVTSTAPSATVPTVPSTVSGTVASAPTYTPPHVANQSWPGNLSYPDDVSAQYPVATTGGEVSATATWSGTPTLVLEVSCAGGRQTQSGQSGLYVSLDAAAGSCAVTLSEPAGTQATVSYTLSSTYPSA